jgi:hypothetical protein
VDLIAIFRDLWRLRRLVVLAGVAALLAAVVVAFEVPSLESRRHEVGVATARILVDTPKSQVLKVAPKGSDTLGLRANVLANVMVEGVVRAAVAERIGLRPSQLQGVAESAAAPSVAPAPSSTTSATNPLAYVLKTRVVASTDGDLPIIEIEAQAPDAARAAKLANAAVEGFRDYLDSKAATEEVPDAERLRVSGLGAAQAGEVVHGPSPVIALVVALFVFGLGCAAILVSSGAIRAWRAVSTEELETRYSGELRALDGLLESEDPRTREWPEPKGARSAGQHGA